MKLYVGLHGNGYIYVQDADNPDHTKELFRTVRVELDDKETQMVEMILKDKSSCLLDKIARAGSAVCSSMATGFSFHGKSGR